MTPLYLDDLVVRSLDDGRDRRLDLVRRHNDADTAGLLEGRQVHGARLALEELKGGWKGQR